MMSCFCILLLSIFLSSVIFFLSVFISMKTQQYTEKMSPYECGFEMISSNRNPFSMKFFLISIIFLIFDMEIIILLSYPFCKTNLLMMNFSSALFFSILTLGFMYEWKIKSLSWLK